MNDQSNTNTPAPDLTSSAASHHGGEPAPAPVSQKDHASLGFLGQIQSHLDSLRSMVGQHAQSQADHVAREAELDRRREEANAREVSLQTFAAAIRERELGIEAREAASATTASELAARAEALSQQADALNEAKQALAQESARAKDELESTRAEAFRALTAAEEMQKAAQAEAARAQESATKAEHESQASREAMAQAASQVAELRESLTRVTSERDDQQRAFATRETQQREAEQALAQRLEAEKARADRLEAALAEARHLLTVQPAIEPKPEASAESQRAIEDARAEASAAASQVENLLRTIESRDDAIRSTAAQVAELQAMIDVATQPAAAPRLDEVDEPTTEAHREHAARVALRQQRLERYKHLLQQQTAKIVKAKAAIQKRANECEQILAQRGKIAEGMEALAQQKRVLDARAAKSGAAAIAAYTMVSLAMIAGLAWGVARQMAPATFAARAEIGADGGSRDLSPDELAAWSTAHLALVKDPQVAAAAAENFARRGMNDLGTASAVKTHVADRLYAQADSPHTIVLEHRAAGSERAARELETFLSAYLALANAQRETRGDGASTVITGTPAAGAEPLDSARMTYAAGIAGGGLMLALTVGLGGYRVLARAKARVERDLADPMA